MKQRLFRNWVLGGLVGTFLIAATSPLFVRSYLLFEIDSIRKVPVLVRGEHYRWRREGYATTRIGAMGMPGGPMVIPQRTSDAELRIALWGDSQAEGVCVADSKKLHRQIQQLAEQAGMQLTVLPLGRSGDDLSDWLSQIPRVDSKLDIDMHLILIAELSDLAVPVPEEESVPDVELALPTNRSRIAEACPAFFIEAIRRTIRNPDDTPRTLRFGVGPVADTLPHSESRQVGPKSGWKTIAKSIEATTDERVLIVYAPNIPIGFSVGGDVAEEALSIQTLKNELEANGIGFVDTRGSLLRSAATNRWPHGFHNGQFGVGHLNDVGYERIAADVVDFFRAKGAPTFSRIAD
ncbi:hypothetical protein Q31b_52420 [Novipirellula aureliae]|uniref:Uncharacterized protein n=1 Tax=Novipirellula aureliae TaxID=2527966 RepID=A0A5C6DIU6_9BACT|nr:hypothetical protein [Novipirellula aureliae]TWU35807.1 hypothetical protein Q31b_52420 [Novipirellula aureliae]